jgi:hypothetical protein
MRCRFRKKCKFYDKNSATCNNEFADMDRNVYCGIKRKKER